MEPAPRQATLIAKQNEIYTKFAPFVSEMPADIGQIASMALLGFCGALPAESVKHVREFVYWALLGHSLSVCVSVCVCGRGGTWSGASVWQEAEGS